MASAYCAAIRPASAASAGVLTFKNGSTGSFGQSASAVWETLKNVSEIYLPAGATPYSQLPTIEFGLTDAALRTRTRKVACNASSAS